MKRIKEAIEIMYHKYSIKKEYQIKGNVILSNQEAEVIYKTLLACEDIIYLLDEYVKYEKSVNVSKSNIEIDFIEKNKYVPPLDELISDKLKSLQYLEEQLKHHKNRLIYYYDKLKLE
jgi:hypothetical protein